MLKSIIPVDRGLVIAQTVISDLTRPNQQSSMTDRRQVSHRERGLLHGPITRLIDPAKQGDRLKPFIFLDFFDAEVKPGFGFGMHPHSGIATLTWQPGCDVRYEDTTGQNGVLRAGGLEWMNAGGGAWHQGQLLTSGRATGFQLWVPMPPVVEDGAPNGQYVPPEQVWSVAIDGGEVRVLLGSFASGSSEAVSAIESHQDMNYFVVTLEPGSHWTYAPPVSHDVAWAFAFDGTAEVLGQTTSKELLTLTGDGPIRFASRNEPVRVLVGTARRHPHPLFLGYSSVHTNARSLADGELRIRAIGRELHQAGRLNA